MFPTYAAGIYTTGALAKALMCSRQHVIDLVRRSGLDAADGRSLTFIDVALIRQLHAWTYEEGRAGFGLGLRDGGSLCNAIRNAFTDATWFHKSLDDLIAAAPVVYAWRDHEAPHTWAVDAHPNYESFAKALGRFNPTFPSPARRMRFDGIIIDVAWSLRWVSETMTPHTVLS